LTRYDLDRVERGEMLAIDDVLEILSIPLLGVIPEDQAVLRASNLGQPVVMDNESQPGQAYGDAVGRFLGEDIPHRFIKREKKGLFGRMFRRSA
jgi:septum site-determining protein MinD